KFCTFHGIVTSFYKRGYLPQQSDSRKKLSELVVRSDTKRRGSSDEDDTTTVVVIMVMVTVKVMVIDLFLPLRSRCYGTSIPGPPPHSNAKSPSSHMARLTAPGQRLTTILRKEFNNYTKHHDSASPEKLDLRDSSYDNDCGIRADDSGMVPPVGVALFKIESDQFEDIGLTLFYIWIDRPTTFSSL
ncbi:hypothetical protein V1477_000479, partial [Vespula maculifrons]